MLYLFLVQANGDAFSEVVFKPLENPPFLASFGGWNYCRYLLFYFDRMLSRISPGIKYLKVSCIT